MCGIFGSTNFGKYAKLYSENCKRGTFAYGHLFIGNGDIHIRKSEGVCDHRDDFERSEEYRLFLGHTQAPTSCERQYQPRTSHPFEVGNFIVAHNGVLENHKKLSDRYLKYPPTFNVDSGYIPALLDESYNGDDVNTISEMMSEIEGTFGCWIFSKHTYQTYIVRSGSTLYGNISSGEFSSSKIPECETVLNEGIIYCVTPEGLTSVGDFKVNTQFFI